MSWVSTDPTDQRTARVRSQLSIELVGGPTAILEYGGLRWLTDPALSRPGEYGGITKLTGPAFDVTARDPIDVVLLSHHHHSDNLDPAGVRPPA
jgi:L-ascorbate metabolism protein UlaG (beta-lactamase superfamily)